MKNTIYKSSDKHILVLTKLYDSIIVFLYYWKSKC